MKVLISAIGHMIITYDIYGFNSLFVFLLSCSVNPGGYGTLPNWVT